MVTTKTVGVVLSGCGFLDGSEVHESVLTLLALDRKGVKVRVFAPNRPQMHVVDHLSRRPDERASRNVLTEAARIARGAIADLATARAGELDAVVFPGGFGAAKNLCTWATHGAKMTVEPQVDSLIKDMRELERPLGFICISPVIAARCVGSGVRLTIGHDAETAAGIEAMGGRHVPHTVEEIEVDEALKVVSTPAYMFDATIAKVSIGIERLVSALLEL